jgi:hypothetical protein
MTGASSFEAVGRRKGGAVAADAAAAERGRRGYFGSRDLKLYLCILH